MPADERPWIRRGVPGAGGTLLDRLLGSRGVTNANRSEFLAPALSQLPRMGGLPGATAVAGRLVEAVRASRRIIIHGDYDADGVAATAILLRIVRAVGGGDRVSSYIPHRVADGYGVAAETLRRLRGEGVDTVVTVDCGVTSIAEADLARQLGLEYLVTDHHEPQRDASGTALMPPADAVCHPCASGWREECPRWPLVPNPCGAGVAWCVAAEFARQWCGSERLPTLLQTLLTQLTGLAALGTIADVVPLVDRNRVIAAVGMRALEADASPGLTMLRRMMIRDGGRLTSEQLAFQLAPAINACGRMDHADDAVRLLALDSSSAGETRELARRCIELNESRKLVSGRMEEEARSMLDESPGECVVLARAGWHVGVIGLVAGRIAESTGRPTVLLGIEDDGTVRGSARSVAGYSILAGLSSCAELLEHYGGHAAAAGLALRSGDLEPSPGAESTGVADQVQRLRDGLCAHVRQATGGASAVAREYDFEASVAECADVNEVSALAQAEPFGLGNPSPTILVRGARLVSGTREMGATRAHVTFTVAPQAGAVAAGRLGPTNLRCVWFGGARQCAGFNEGAKVDLLIKPRRSEFRGVSSAEAVVAAARLLRE